MVCLCVHDSPARNRPMRLGFFIDNPTESFYINLSEKGYGKESNLKSRSPI
jgi:hypothetical protein